MFFIISIKIIGHSDSEVASFYIKQKNRIPAAQL